MTQRKESKGKGRFWHWVRVVVSFLSFGFIFPHAMTEDMDIGNHTTDKEASVKG
jgi:hypothetical protein